MSKRLRKLKRECWKCQTTINFDKQAYFVSYIDGNKKKFISDKKLFDFLKNIGSDYPLTGTTCKDCYLIEQLIA